MTQVGDDKVELLHDGAAYLPAMMTAIKEAASEILLEMYWFGSDPTGRSFAAALEARARAGVRVCVIYDAFGSWDTDSRMFVKLQEAGCLVYCYNPISRYLARFSWRRLSRRDHRKMLIVDGRIAFTGGVNLADAWAPDEYGHGGFRDDMIRVEGSSAIRMRQIFLQTFLRGMEDSIDDAWKRQLQLSDDKDTTQSARIFAVTNEGRGQRRAIDRAYLERISAARKSVLLANSYFIPRPAVRRALAAAAARGVEVKLLLSGESDVPGVNYASRWLYDWMLRHGIAVYLWRTGILHAKTAVFDDEWCTVGTHNFDYRSLNFNLEINLFVHSDELASALAQRMRRDLAESQQIERATWRFRSLSERFFEWLFFRMRRLM